MKDKDTNQSVQIYKGVYSSTIFEMEVWTLYNEYEYTDEEYQEQQEQYGEMDCCLSKECIGLFPTKERALEDLGHMYEDPYDSDREVYCAFIRERPMYCMMGQGEYLKEWTYCNGILHDESIVRNYALDDNPFLGRPMDMVRFKRGDIVMILEGNYGHWGIVCGVPITPEHIKEVNDRIERETGVPGNKYSGMDYSDDCYIILTSDEEYMKSHEHILSHHVLPAPKVPEFVRKTLEKGLERLLKK